MDDTPPSAVSGAPSRGPAPPGPPQEGLGRRVGLLLVVLCAILGTGTYLGSRVIGALPDVGKNLHPGTPWAAPIALERKPNGWLIAHIPSCAQGPVAGLVLWDDRDQTLWELRGEAFPIGDLLLGSTVPGMKVVHPFASPPLGRQLRLGLFRATGRPIGVTFRVHDLRDGKVRYGGKWITVDQFRLSARCAKPKVVTTQPPATTASPAVTGP